MSRYLYTMATLLDNRSGSKRKYSQETIISGIFNQDLSEVDWILVLGKMELIYGIEIPQELYDRMDLSLGEYAYELSQLPIISIEQYPEFYDIKMESMILTKRYIELETKTDEDSVRELNQINQQFELLTDHLNVLLGNILVN